MAYTNVWNDTLPTGSEDANTLDDIIRGLKTDIDQRIIDIFAMPSMATDPLRPYGMKFTDAQDSVLFLGDNAGTPRSLKIKDKTGTNTYFTFNSTTFTVAPAASFMGGFAATLTSIITSGAVLTAISATTGNLFLDFTNTSGALILGLESSIGGTLFTGTTAYSTVFGTSVDQSVHIAANNAVAMTITKNGVSIIKSLTVNTSALIVGTLQMTNDVAVQWGGSNDRIEGTGTASHYLKFFTANILRLLIDNGGQASFSGPIQTADPSSGSGVWRLGTIIATGVALDATRYVEIKIGGTVVKLGIVT